MGSWKDFGVLGIKLRFLNQPPVSGRGKGGRNLPEFLEKVLES